MLLYDFELMCLKFMSLFFALNIVTKKKSKSKSKLVGFEVLESFHIKVLKSLLKCSEVLRCRCENICIL